MWNKLEPREMKSLIGAMVLAFCATPTPAKAQDAQTKQAQVLAEIAMRIVTCSAHPCLGDSEQDVRKELHNTIVSDGVFDYSDVAVAYPQARRIVSGVVEWDFDPKLDTVSLKITDLRAEPSLLLSELKHALPGCQMEGKDDGDTDNPEAEEEDAESDVTREWSCSAQGYSSANILVEIYYVPGMLLLEVGP